MLPDSILANDLKLAGASPLRATPPVRSLLSAPVVVPHRIIAAILVKGDDAPHAVLPTFVEDELEGVAKQLSSRGIKAVKVFVDSYAPSHDASAVYDANGLSPRAISKLKSAAPEICVITDTCLCSYTDQGNCALTSQSGEIDEDATFEKFRALADIQLKAGADILGPAPMMNGAVSALRKHLDATGYRHVPLMPHLSWRSTLYRTYRAAMNTGLGIQRQAFQIDPTRPEQFLSMGERLKYEGADIIQMQPGLFSLDMASRMREHLQMPVALYSVSGEYAMMKAACTSNDEFKEILHEHATACLRSGVDFIVTYAWQELTDSQGEC
ncbi:hypothetical protein [Lacipirellula sp.]|uniref:hypothetical protein n=1 Tax=Lacipirellula sp. TaxID=2691419 RepID=UPI003D0AA003